MNTSSVRCIRSACRSLCVGRISASLPRWGRRDDGGDVFRPCSSRLRWCHQVVGVCHWLVGRIGSDVRVGDLAGGVRRRGSAHRRFIRSRRRRRRRRRVRIVVVALFVWGRPRRRIGRRRSRERCGAGRCTSPPGAIAGRWGRERGERADGRRRSGRGRGIIAAAAASARPRAAAAGGRRRVGPHGTTTSRWATAEGTSTIPITDHWKLRWSDDRSGDQEGPKGEGEKETRVHLDASHIPISEQATALTQRPVQTSWPLARFI